MKDAISQARPDGRPQYYDITKGDRVQCCLCLRDKNFAQYGRFEAMVADPGNSPMNDGGVYTICLNHIPDNGVIHDPIENVTRTKDGQNSWTEADTTEGKMPPQEPK